MLSLVWLIAFCGTTLYLAYRRASLARATLVLGALVLAYTLWGGAGWAFVYFKKRSKKMREFLDRLILKIPIIGPILNKAAIARYARTLATMFAAGVPLVEALESVAGATGNIVYENAVLRMRDEVATGQRLQRITGTCSGLPRFARSRVAFRK